MKWLLLLLAAAGALFGQATIPPTRPSGSVVYPYISGTIVPGRCAQWVTRTSIGAASAACGSGSGSGLSSLNGLTGSTQTFSTGTSGSDFNINSSGTAHTFNFPSASGSARGLLTSTDWNTFSGKAAVAACDTNQVAIATLVGGITCVSLTLSLIHI